MNSVADFYPSRIPDLTTSTKEEKKKMFVVLVFVATKKLSKISV